MALHYLDSSAIGKRYLQENGTAWVRSLFQTSNICFSLLTNVELASMVARRVREGTLTPYQRDNILLTYAIDFRSASMIALDHHTISEARQLLLIANQPNLRTLDAIHLASARLGFNAAQASGETIGDFVTADRHLLAAAAALGFSVTNPEDHP